MDTHTHRREGGRGYRERSVPWIESQSLHIRLHNREVRIIH